MLAYFPIAKKLKLYDLPNERSSHKNITFEVGGILIPISLIFYLIFSRFHTGLSKFYLAYILTLLISTYKTLKYYIFKHSELSNEEN